MPDLAMSTPEIPPAPGTPAPTPAPMPTPAPPEAPPPAVPQPVQPPAHDPVPPAPLDRRLQVRAVGTTSGR
jgi:hypothetical protein